MTCRLEIEENIEGRVKKTTEVLLEIVCHPGREVDKL